MDRCCVCGEGYPPELVWRLCEREDCHCETCERCANDLLDFFEDAAVAIAMIYRDVIYDLMRGGDGRLHARSDRYTGR